MFSSQAPCGLVMASVRRIGRIRLPAGGTTSRSSNSAPSSATTPSNARRCPGQSRSYAAMNSSPPSLHPHLLLHLHLHSHDALHLVGGEGILPPIAMPDQPTGRGIQPLQYRAATRLVGTGTEEGRKSRRVGDLRRMFEDVRLTDS
jgi:hypothetical protein